MIKMIVFDMAGTTVDENNVVYKTLMHAINAKQFNFTIEEVLAEGAGKEKLQAIRGILASKQVVDEAVSQEIFKHFLTMLDKAYQTQDIAEQPHASSVFKALREKGVLVVLNTGYDWKTAESLVKKIGWQENVDYDLLVTASDVEKNRPNPDMIFFAMRKLGINDPTEVIKVGDSSIDIEEGQNAGCKASVGITTGAHSREQLSIANPDFIIDDLIELLSIVDSLSILTSK